MFSPLDSRGNGGHHDLKHVEIECKLGFGIGFSNSRTILKGADWLRHIFVHSATIMTWNKNLAMPPSSIVHCDQYDTMYMAIGCILRKAFADDNTILGLMREPARIFDFTCEVVNLQVTTHTTGFRVHLWFYLLQCCDIMGGIISVVLRYDVRGRVMLR